MRKISQMLGAILGGAVGLALGYIVVYAITGNDLFGLLTRHKATSPTRAATAPPTIKATPLAPPPVRESETTTATLVGAVEPAASVSESADSPTIPPAPPASSPSVAETPPRILGVEPPRPASDPVPPVYTRATGKQEKHPQPTPEEQEKMLARLRSIYQGDFEKIKAGKKEDREKLTAQFREEALKLNSEPVAKFIMLKEALEQALALHDFVTAADIVDDLEATFEVGGYALRLRLLSDVAKVSKTKSPEEKAQLIEFALDLAEYAQATESIDDLPKLAVILDELAREINERELKTQKDSKTQKGMRDLKSEVANRSADLRNAAKDFALVLAARQRLADDPSNPADSLLDGRFRCFFVGNWSAGLKLLAQSNHAALATAATNDLAGPSEGTTTAAIGDMWFDLAEADASFKSAFARARHWYKQAVLSAQGLEKLKIDKRLEKIGNLKLSLALNERWATPSLASAHFMLTRVLPASRGPEASRAILPMVANPLNEPLSDPGLIPVAADGRPLNLNFERGTLEGWKAEGEAFEGQPVKGDTAARRPGFGKKSEHTGQFWIGGYEVLRDLPTGTLSSEPFEVMHPWASFLVGGGSSRQTRVEIVTADDNKVFYEAMGRNEENLRPVIVNLRPIKGRKIFIRLVDQASGDWGHINFDDFRAHSRRPRFSTMLPTDLRVFSGHNQPVTRAVFSADMKTMLTCSLDGTVRHWNVASGAELKRMNVENWVWGVAFLPDGRAISTSDREPRIWDLKTGALVNQLSGPTKRQTYVAVSRDGRRVATVGFDEMMHVWDLSSRKLVQSARGAGTLWSVRFTPDGKQTISSGDARDGDSAVLLRDIDSGATTMAFRGHTAVVGFLDISLDGTLLATGSHDGSLRVWNMQTGKMISRFDGHADKIQGLTFCPDGESVLSGDYGGNVCLTDARTGAELWRVHAHDAIIGDISVSPDGQLMLTCGHDKTARLWQLPSLGNR